MRRSPLPLGFALILSFLSAPVRAQTPASRPDSATTLPGLTILESADRLARIPGSAQQIDASRLRQSRVFSTNEALRKVSGLVVRDEEGLGLRPNIGVRGLNPTRSTKVLLLEDGVPLTLAPYGDNAAYYHPPVTRMERIEVLKGAGQILYGPQTVGGVINYITPGLPSDAGGLVRLSGANNDLRGVYVRSAARNAAGGALVDIGQWRAAGARANTASELTDGSLKLFVPLSPTTRLVAKGNLFRERSQVTYSGLTEAEWAADARQNPFRNDHFDIARLGAFVAHEWMRGPQRLRTTFYAHDISRDWWRQSSSSTQRPNDAADPSCGSLANLESGCGNEGRLRRYQVFGVEPRLERPVLWGSLAGTLDAGLRLHRELQLRRQLNGAAHDSRSGMPVEDNRRGTDAIAGFVQLRLGSAQWTVSPGLRVEHITISRRNRLPLPGSPSGVGGRTALTEWIPGLGATWTPRAGLSVFAGAHRGFAPPRNEDIISNSTGSVVELDAERSWNYEVGTRWSPAPGWAVEATAFRLDFESQVVPASVAGGAGATLTNAGRTLHQGLELDVHGAFSTRGAVVPFVALAATWMPVARFEGARFAYIGTGGADVVGKVYAEQNGTATRTVQSVTGNRLPYAPELVGSATLGLRHRRGADLSVEAVHVSRQFGDPANTRTTVPDGQQGPLSASTLWNATANLPISPLQVTAFVSVKNAFDALVLVDRSRGLLPGMGRVVMLGLERSF